MEINGDEWGLMGKYSGIWEIMGIVWPINLGKFDHDLTVLPNPGLMVSKGNYPNKIQ